MTTAARASSIVTLRYATALLDLAEKDKALDKVEQDLGELRSMIESSGDLQKFIRNPLISKQAQNDTILALSKKAKFQTLTENFLCVLVANKRLNILDDVLSAVKESIAKRRGEKFASVTVAQDLTDKQIDDLKKSLEKSAGSAVSIEINVDPAILGGMIVTMDSTMIDDSVARKLERLKAVMSRGANENTTKQNLSEVS